MSGVRSGHLQGTVWGVEVRERPWREKKWGAWGLQETFWMSEKRAVARREYLVCPAEAPGEVEVEARVVAFRRSRGRRGGGARDVWRA